MAVGREVRKQNCLSKHEYKFDIIEIMFLHIACRFQASVKTVYVINLVFYILIREHKRKVALNRMMLLCSSLLRTTWEGNEVSELKWFRWFGCLFYRCPVGYGVFTHGRPAHKWNVDLQESLLNSSLLKLVIRVAGRSQTDWWQVIRECYLISLSHRPTERREC